MESVGVLFVIIGLNKKVKIKREFSWIFKFSIIICVWDVLLSVISGYYQFHYCKTMVTPVGSVFGACILYEYSKKLLKNEITFHLFFVSIIFSECVITFLMSLSPSLFQIVNSIQITAMADMQVTDNDGFYRMLGLGSAVYFGVLPICAFSLLSCSYLICNKVQEKKKVVFIIIAFLTIGVVSFFSARTSLLLVAVALLPVIFHLRKMNIGNIVFYGVIVIAVVSFGVNYIQNNFNDSMMKWALDFIINKDLEGDAAGTVVDWIINTKFDDIGTLIWGDGCYENPDGTYYKMVDVGWYRNIFYSGIIGVSLILYFHYKVSLFIYKSHKTKNMKLMLILLFVSYAIILLKGDGLMLSFLILYLMYYKDGIFERKLSFKNRSVVYK